MPYKTLSKGAFALFISDQRSEHSSAFFVKGKEAAVTVYKLEGQEESPRSGAGREAV